MRPTKTRLTIGIKKKESTNSPDAKQKLAGITRELTSGNPSNSEYLARLQAAAQQAESTVKESITRAAALQARLNEAFKDVYRGMDESAYGHLIGHVQATPGLPDGTVFVSHAVNTASGLQHDSDLIASFNRQSFSFTETEAMLKADPRSTDERPSLTRKLSTENEYRQRQRDFDSFLRDGNKTYESYRPQVLKIKEAADKLWQKAGQNKDELIVLEQKENALKQITESLQELRGVMRGDINTSQKMLDTAITGLNWAEAAGNKYLSALEWLPIDPNSAIAIACTRMASDQIAIAKGCIDIAAAMVGGKLAKMVVGKGLQMLGKTQFMKEIFAAAIVLTEDVLNNVVKRPDLVPKVTAGLSAAIEEMLNKTTGNVSGGLAGDTIDARASDVLGKA